MRVFCLFVFVGLVLELKAISYSAVGSVGRNVLFRLKPKSGFLMQLKKLFKTGFFDLSFPTGESSLLS